MNTFSGVKRRKPNIIGIIKVDFMAEQLYMIALDCTGQVTGNCIHIYISNNNSVSDVHNEVTNECI